MAMLGKKRPPRRASKGSGLARDLRERAPATAAATEGSIAELVIERLAHDGRGVSRLASGKTVFVDAALPGERVEIAVHRTRKRFDEAHVKRRLSDAPERTTPPCEYVGRCGGCDLQHMTLAAQREHKREVVRELLARQGLELPGDITVLATDDDRYRRRTRLGVNVDSQGRVYVGFRARGSHRLVDIERCHVLMPGLDALMTPLRELIQTLAAPRQVGHVELLESAAGRAIIVRQLKAHAEDAERWRGFAEGLAQGAGGDVALGLLQGRESPTLEWLTPPPALADRLARPETTPLSLGFAPGDFLQVNARVNALMVERVLGWLAPGPGQRVLDLFAGIGNFSLPMAAAGARVTAAEGSPAMVKRLADNARANGLEVEAVQADLNQPEAIEPLLRDAAPDTLILDPPRAGAEAVCEALARASARPSRLAFVSCDPATLARDLSHLVAGGYAIRQVAVADMFVHTAHMETLILLHDTLAQHRGTGIRGE